MLSQFPFKNSMCCSSVRLYWNICVKVEMCFPSLALKLPPFRVNSTWLPNPNHDCSLSQAHPHVDLSWSSVQAKREAEKKNLGQWLLSLPVSRVSCRSASRRVCSVQSGLWNVLRHGLRSGQSETSPAEACARTGTPLDQSEECSKRVYTHGAHG